MSLVMIWLTMHSDLIRCAVIEEILNLESNGSRRRESRLLCH